VPSLTGDAAIELFIERADTAASGFRPDDADLVVIGEICGRLDGIALAIELAAARVRSMSPTQIRDRLDERFRLLTGSRRSIERHQTLRHAVQWSYDLLEPVEQSVLQQVSVFAGGFTLKSATTISELDEYEVLDILDSLVRKSLLHVDRGDSDVRYAMLETIRQFAEEALAATGTSDETRDRHAHYFADQTDIAFAAFPTEDEWLAYRFVDTEISNLTAAFQWAMSRHDTDTAVRIAANIQIIARNRSRTETVGWPEQALDLARRDQHRQLPLLLAAACDAASSVGRYDDAIGNGLEAITLNHDDRYNFTIHAYWTTAVALFSDAEVDQAIGVLRNGAEHPADAPARPNLVYLHVLARFGGVVISTEETMDAVTQLKASSMPALRAGGLWVQAMAVADDDPSAAIALCQQALDADTGSRSTEESVRGFQLGLIAQTGDIDAALNGFTHIIDAYQASSGDHYTRSALSFLVIWLARLGYHDGAARLAGAITRGRPDWWPDPSPEIVTLRDTMGNDAYIAAVQAGAALDPRATGELAYRLLTQVRADHLDT
jgi:tetratricopeptide (TPR) repeat protein